MEKQCKHFDICGLQANSPDQYCILHSPDIGKDPSKFRKEYENHIQNIGYRCDFFVFPIELDFTISPIEGKTFDDFVSFEGVRFTKKVTFDLCAFPEGVSFENAIFDERTLFHGTLFVERATFVETKFFGQTDFGESSFRCNANFLLTQFFQRVEFFSTKFEKNAEFRDSIFYEGARFLETQFNGEDAQFSFSSFLAPTNFSSGRNSNPIFNGCKLYFEEVIINPSNVLAFKNACFSTAVLRGTDMRNVELSGIQWANYKKRVAVYDEIKLEKDDDKIIRYDTLEELYRNLKQNYTDRRDFLKAGHFHYGEKETLRKNPKTSFGVKFLLSLYKVISGYSERILPAIISITVLFLGSIAIYMYGGIFQTVGRVGTIGETATTIDYLIYSLETMFFIDSGRYQAASHISSIATIIQKVFSPILLALLALAVRQRLKR